MVNTARSVEWPVVATEVEALQLEWTWIKEYDPRFNVMFKDDKSYPWLAVTVGKEFPRAQVMRGARRKGVRYFGPFGSAWAIRQTLDLLTRVFPIRTCSDSEFKRCSGSGAPICSPTSASARRPCVGRISAEDYRELVNGFCAFMSGEHAPCAGASSRRCRMPPNPSSSSGPRACATTSARSTRSSNSRSWSSPRRSTAT